METCQLIQELPTAPRDWYFKFVFTKLQRTQGQDQSYQQDSPQNLFGFGSRRIIFWLDVEQPMQKDDKQLKEMIRIPAGTFVAKLRIEIDPDYATEILQEPKNMLQGFERLIRTIHRKQRLITSIELSKLGLNDHSIEVFADCNWRFVDALSLSFNNISHQGIKVLSNCSLRWLKKLDLGFNKIGNKGIKALFSSPFPNLEKLDLRSTNLTVDSLKYLKKRCFKNLESIVLDFQSSQDLISGLRGLMNLPVHNIYIAHNEDPLIYNNANYFAYFNNQAVKSQQFHQECNLKNSTALNSNTSTKTLILEYLEGKLKVRNWVPQQCTVTQI